MQYIHVALNYADKSIVKTHKHGAVCLIGGKVVSGGCNKPDEPHWIKCGNKKFKYGWSLHAEIAAILKLPSGINMRKVKLVVVRQKMKMSKPCNICIPALKAIGINKIYYSCNGELVRL